MKKIISENDGYRVFVELAKSEHDIGKVQISFFSESEHFKNHNDVQHKFSMWLTEDEIKKLTDFLSE